MSFLGYWAMIGMIAAGAVLSVLALIWLLLVCCWLWEGWKLWRRRRA